MPISAQKINPCLWFSWQVVPTLLYEMLVDPDPQKVKRVTKSFLQMKKFDIAALRRAFDGGQS